jgi:sugar phosphate isomerase/epimerase
MDIGFSTGCFHKIYLDTITEETIQTYSENGITILELLVKNDFILNKLLKIDKSIFNKFSRLSFHAPVNLIYKNSKETIGLLNKIRDVVRNFGIKVVVIHADIVGDWSVFDKYLEIAIAVENMDDRKSIGQHPQDLLPLLNNSNLGFVLDLQHIFVNDNSMELAFEFLNKFKDRLSEIHISAYNKELNHHLLFQEKQEIIITTLKKILEIKDVPVIIESPIDKVEDLKLEWDYILSNL